MTAQSSVAAMNNTTEFTGLNRVPEVTVDFWLIKLMAVTVGETAADFLALNLGLGLQTTTYLMSAILVGVIAFQFAQKRYVPWAYWSAVVMVSVVGTLLTDNLIDTFGVPLETTTVACTVILAMVFAAWYASEKTLSIHTVVTTRREIFYWLAVLATFALGTAAGDYVSEALGVGYLATGVVFAGVIAAVAFAHYVLKLNAILAFWLAYIFTRPLGASLGDLLSQPTEYGGMGLGTIGTSAMFLTIIAAIVIYMTIKRRPSRSAPVQ
ncbi:MAG: hypothetical protein ACOH2N_19185 [Devosia sp.]